MDWVLRGNLFVALDSLFVVAIRSVKKSVNVPANVTEHVLFQSHADILVSLLLSIHAIQS